MKILGQGIKLILFIKQLLHLLFSFICTILDSLLKVTGVLSDYLQGEEILSTAAASTISTQVFP